MIRSFTAALQKGMDYVQSHSPEEIAAVIQPQFEENDLETLAAIIARYDEQDTWKEDLIFEEDSFTLLQNILEEGGELERRVPYEDLVNTAFAKEAKELEKNALSSAFRRPARQTRGPPESSRRPLRRKFCKNKSKKSLPRAGLSVIILSARGIGAVGSAPHWQCGGHGFESRMLHFISPVHWFADYS